MAVVDVQLYIARAKDFFSAMQLMRDDELYENSTALLAIHSAISYADALRNGLGQMSQQAEDHTKAVNSLLSLLRDRGFGDEGVLRISSICSRRRPRSVIATVGWIVVRYVNLRARLRGSPVGQTLLACD